MFPAECRSLSLGIKLKNKKKKSQSVHQAIRDCYSREKCHCPNSIISSIGTSNPPHLSCLTRSLFSASCFPALQKQKGRMYLGHLPQNSFSDILQVGHVGVLSLNASWQERWMHNLWAVCQREQQGEESLISNSADAEGWSPCQKEEIPSSASHSRYLALRWKPESEQEEKETSKAVKAALTSTSFPPSKGSASNWFFWLSNWTGNLWKCWYVQACVERCWS